MPDRLSSLDTMFLYAEEQNTPMHVGSVMIFDAPSDGFDYESLVSLVSNRIAFVPRYRQKVRNVPGGLLNPVWVDDQDFDITYHVRRSALPRPGSRAQLEEFVARIQARPLDRSRPLWELYVVDGLHDDRFAIVTKTHEVLVDGVHAIDLGQVIVDSSAGREDTLPPTWRASRQPTDLELIAGAAVDALRSPVSAVKDGVHSTLRDAKGIAGKSISTIANVAGAVARSATRPAPQSPLNAPLGAHRRFVMVETDLAEYQAIRARVTTNGPERVTVNDVVLATIAGALRSWLLTRGQPVNTGEKVRAMVPVSVHEPDLGGHPGDRVVACFVDLPVGEPRPGMRVLQIAYEMHQQIGGGSALGAQTLSALAGFAPPTLHSLGARLGSAVSRRMFNMVVNNVPGPQQTMWAAEAAMVAQYPVIPLARSQALSIGLTSYAGKVFFGLNADRDAMPDVDILGQCLTDALAELGEEKELTL